MWTHDTTDLLHRHRRVRLANPAGQLLPEIDELIVERYPVVAGGGPPMFGTGFTPTPFTLVTSRTFESGAVVGTYRRP
ncbi:hypothetical protein [Catenuloplanes atrovinosus]|uniref:Dihydrofolate reductase n=1 Tax=Catenuloplanes atrovinosus TaxID=137266 RepID=A0AAE3YN81_9ACTN|nr:hypothetical protein [Catenuloplanes atrovinosus]MDR7274896.1 dihydrofolate reductase [Catenuloplanes atrovinosus]